MSKRLSKLVRDEVSARAGNRCEYCRLRGEDAFFSFHIDHIRSIKHGGSDDLDNLAYSCATCNAFKGSDIATIVDPEGTLVRLFHPRTDVWEEHFTWEGVTIKPLTLIGRATCQVLQLNHVDRLIERQEL